MRGPTRLLWGLGAVAVTSLMVAFSLSNWHWYTLLMKVQFMIESPEIHGFHPPYPNSEIAENGISPNGQLAFIVAYSIEEGVSAPPNCLVMRSGESFSLPTHIATSSTGRESYDGVIRWAKNSSAVLCFSNSDHSTESGVFSRGAYDIYVIPIINGRPGKITSMEFEILKVADPEAAAMGQVGEFKDFPDFYAQISDKGMDENLTFNDANQIVINCWCTSIPRDPKSGFSKSGATTHVTGLWDSLKGRFIKTSHETVLAPN